MASIEAAWYHKFDMKSVLCTNNGRHGLALTPSALALSFPLYLGPTYLERCSFTIGSFVCSGSYAFIGSTKRLLLCYEEEEATERALAS